MKYTKPINFISPFFVTPQSLKLWIFFSALCLILLCSVIGSFSFSLYRKMLAYKETYATRALSSNLKEEHRFLARHKHIPLLYKDLFLKASLPHNILVLIAEALPESMWLEQYTSYKHKATLQGYALHATDISSFMSHISRTKTIGKITIHQLKQIHPHRFFFELEFLFSY